MSEVVKPTWLLTTRCSVPPGAAATGARQVEGALVDAQAAEGGVAVDQHRHHLTALVVVAALLARRAPSLPPPG